MSNELETKLNGANVTVSYDAVHDEVLCYDSGTGMDYTSHALTVIVEEVWFGGIDISSVLSESDLTALEMECRAHYDGVEA